MRILYIATSVFRNTSASIRNVSLINGLVELGNEIDILTLDYNKELEDKYLVNYINNLNVDIHKIKIPFFNSIKKREKDYKIEDKKNFIYSYIKRIIKKNLFFPDNLYESIKNSKEFEGGNYDLVISSSDSKTSHFIADNLFKLKKISGKWIQIWGDPWSGDINLGKNNLLQFRIKRKEKYLLNKADKIFYISELTANLMKIKIKNPQKVEVLERSFLVSVSNEWNFKKLELVISYTGVLINRNILPILETVNLYNLNSSQKKIYINFYGSDSFKYSKFENEYIKFYDKVDFSKIEEIYKKTDILLYIDNLGQGSQIPGKIYDYCGTNRPILALIENEKVGEILKKISGIIVVNNRKEEINLDTIISNLKLREIEKKFSPIEVGKNFLRKI